MPIPCQGDQTETPELGFLVDTRLRPFAFDGRTKHATTKWEGDRWVMTFYVVNRPAISSKFGFSATMHR